MSSDGRNEILSQSCPGHENFQKLRSRFSLVSVLPRSRLDFPDSLDKKLELSACAYLKYILLYIRHLNWLASLFSDCRFFFSCVRKGIVAGESIVRMRE